MDTSGGSSCRRARPTLLMRAWLMMVRCRSWSCRCAVADDELALAAADRDHGVDGHDAGEDGLGDGFADDDAGGDLLDGIEFLASIGPLPSTGGRGRRPRGRAGRGPRTERSLPVVWTSSPSLSEETSPSTTQPTSSSSRLSAMPMAPPGNCTISLYMTSTGRRGGPRRRDGADGAGVFLTALLEAWRSVVRSGR